MSKPIEYIPNSDHREDNVINSLNEYGESKTIKRWIDLNVEYYGYQGLRDILIIKKEITFLIRKVKPYMSAIKHKNKLCQNEAAHLK